MMTGNYWHRASADTHGSAKVHLKIDTGLGRFGLNEEEAVRVCQQIVHQEQLYLEGIYTHTADPTAPRLYRSAVSAIHAGSESLGAGRALLSRLNNGQ